MTAKHETKNPQADEAGSIQNHKVAIDSLEAERDRLADNRWARQQETRGPEAAQKILDELKQQKLSLQAEALVSGIAPDLRENDKKMEAATAALNTAIEKADVARLAIDKIDARQKEIDAEIERLEGSICIAGMEHIDSNLKDRRQKLAKAREDLAEAQSRESQAKHEAMQLVKDYLRGKVEKSLRPCVEELLPLLLQRIDKLQQRAAGDGMRIDTSSAAICTVPGIGVREIRREEDNELGDVLRRMKILLAVAAPNAEVLAEVFGEERIKRTLLGFLRELGMVVQNAVRTNHIAVPEWSYAPYDHYRQWTKPEALEPVKQFLADSGVTW